jgi:N-glycosylase/DNA lyase
VRHRELQADKVKKLNKTEAFPVDVWMKRALEKYFPEGIDVLSLGKSAGIAQQYLFYYEKYIQST